MKIVEKDSKVIKTFEVDYENGIKCEYTTTNGKLTKYSFSSDKTSLTYVENIDELRDIEEEKEILSKKRKKELAICLVTEVLLMVMAHFQKKKIIKLVDM